MEDLIESRKDKLFFYSPYNYIQQISFENQFELVKKDILTLASDTQNCFYEYGEAASKVVLLFQFLKWDSNHFKVPTYQLRQVLFGNKISNNDLAIAISNFKKQVLQSSPSYCSIEIPSEDVFLLQALCDAGFRLIETRLHFYKDTIQTYDQERYPVRIIDSRESEKLQNIASTKRNDYDRVHADYFYSMESADHYLATYASEAVKGFCECVIVPDEVEYDAFLAIGHTLFNKEHFYRVSLVAVGEQSKGWHVKLVSETIQYAKQRNASFVFMTTQSTNRAVFRTCEKLGFKLGATTHVLSTHY